MRDFIEDSYRSKKPSVAVTAPATVRDPFVTQEAHDEQWRLQMKANRQLAPEQRKVANKKVAVTTGLIGTLCSMLPIAVSGGVSPLSFIPLVVAVVTAVATVSFMTWRANCIRAKLAAYPLTYHEVAKSAGWLMDNLASNLAKLPAASRGEFRPLWAAAVEANAYLISNPDHAASVERIRLRASTVAKVLAEKQALDEAEKEALEAEARREIESRAPEANDEDLEMAEQAISAMAEGRATYRMLAELPKVEKGAGA